MGIVRAARLAFAAAALIIVGACSGSPRFTNGSATRTPDAAPVPVPAGRTGDAGSSVVRAAAAFVGTPYRKGGTTENGVDCSGLTLVAYRSVGVRLPRSSHEQARIGVHVPQSELVPGDLVFFGSSASNISHVGIYAGDGEFIHASTRARSVRFDRLDNKYFRARYVTARRVQ